MTDAAAGLVHVVDDDPAIRDSLAWLFRSRGIRTTLWDSGEAFLAGAGIGAEQAGESGACVILDLRMAGWSGFDTFERMKTCGLDLPVVFLTGHGDVPLAVEAVKKGAADFVEKPFNDNVLVDIVLAAIGQAAAERSVHRDRAKFTRRLDSLTPREHEVFERLLAGKLNKQIAEDLGLSMRTVEVHRSRVFEKMAVRNAGELAGMVSTFAGR